MTTVVRHPLPALEREDAPRDRRVAGPSNLCRGAVGELRDHVGPERERATILLGDAYGPRAREVSPDEKRSVTPDAGSSILTHHEEVLDVEHRRIVARRRSALGEHESSDLAIAAN